MTNYWNILPDELIVKMCENIDGKDLHVLTSTSRNVKRVCSDILLSKDISQIINIFKSKEKIDPDNLYSIKGEIEEFSENLRDLYFKGNKYHAILTFNEYMVENHNTDLIIEAIKFVNDSYDTPKPDDVFFYEKLAEKVIKYITGHGMDINLSESDGPKILG